MSSEFAAKKDDTNHLRTGLTFLGLASSRLTISDSITLQALTTFCESRRMIPFSTDLELSLESPPVKRGQKADREGRYEWKLLLPIVIGYTNVKVSDCPPPFRGTMTKVTEMSHPRDRVRRGTTKETYKRAVNNPKRKIILL